MGDTTKAEQSCSSTAQLAKSMLSDPSWDSIEAQYDPYDHRKLQHPNNFSGALMHLLKSSLGVGLLAIPSAIAAAGILVGVLGTIFIGILCAHTIHLLIFASQEMCRKLKVPMLGFSETAHAVFKFGPKRLRFLAEFARYFVDLALLLTYYASNAVYIVFISDTIRKLVAYHVAEASSWPTQYYILMILPPLILCCQVRQLKHLVPFSVVANTTMVIAFGIALYYIFSGIANVDMGERKLTNDITLIPKFFSTVLLAMEGIGTMLPIENSMTENKFLGCPGVLNIAMSCVVGMYTTVGLFGYLRFGDGVSANMIGDFPPGEITADVAKVCIAIAVFFTYMLQFYVPVDITWRKLSTMIPQKHHNVAQIILRCVLVIVAAGVAAAVPKLDIIISLVGAVLFSTLGLFVPVVIDVILNLRENGDFGVLKWRLWKNILIAILSWVALFSGAYYAIVELIHGD